VLSHKRYPEEHISLDAKSIIVFFHSNSLGEPYLTGVYRIFFISKKMR